MLKNISILLLFILCACESQQIDELQGYVIEEGFNLEIIAQEPLLEAPVAMDFDTRGRIWVTEMNSYMKNIQGSGMEDPTGRILILEDQDGDGVTDTSKVFLSGLVLPRALALVYGGLLYAEPPNLWFVEIENDLPGDRVLVDSLYAPTGNPEHQPNGLMLNVDNWIYNAKSQFRYRRNKGVWEKEATSFRGQWGIAHDNFGRLYYNNNYTQLLGDYVMPNRLIKNRYFKPTEGINKKLTQDQRVYPLYASSVNRGYVEGVLNEDSLLVEVTAACGPQVYRGDKFPEDYRENVFVCLPEANLVKRNILTISPDKVEARQAWQGKEFLASNDEGFRPVNISNGPDGNLYVVDMHRGIIGHYAYLSPYLREKIRLKQLDSLMGMGRILRISQGDQAFAEIPDLNELSGNELASMLRSENGWLRDRAQHLIVYKNLVDITNPLEQMALDAENAVAQIHALYTLYGLDRLTAVLLKQVAVVSSAEVTAHAVMLLEDFASKEEAASIQGLFRDLISRDELTIDIYLAFTLGAWVEVSEELFNPVVVELALKHIGNALFEEALISGASNSSMDALRTVRNSIKNDDASFSQKLAGLEKNKKSNSINPLFLDTVLPEDERTRGWKLFNKTCAACHGPEGLGIEGLAPPLMNSEYITESKKRLSLIILHGVTGPIHVKGKLYDKFHSMPGLKHNESLTDEDIADIVAYVTSSFSAIPRNISPAEIGKFRDLKPESGAGYTEQELLEIQKGNESSLYNK